jgi:hypothetical protein
MRRKAKRTRRALRITTAAVGIAVVILVVVPEWAAASCAAPVGIPEAIRRADAVVVGTVTATRSRDRIATVSIDEVWKGTIAGSVEVHGGPTGDNTMTSVDRTYEVGRRYLIFAFEPAAHDSTGSFGARYEDNDCSDTQPWNASLIRYRPAAAANPRKAAPRPNSALPAAPARSDRDTMPWLVVGVGGAAVLAGGGVLVRRRRRGYA